MPRDIEVNSVYNKLSLAPFGCFDLYLFVGFIQLEFFDTFLVSFLLMVEELSIKLGGHILDIRQELESVNVWDIVDWELILLENKT